MAFRAVNYWRSILNRMGANRSIATSTAPRMKSSALIADSPQSVDARSRVAMKGEFFPVYVALGMILVSTTLGLHTAKHELRYNPTVRVNKKRREKLVEVEEPERALDEAEKFIKKSLFRKVAHQLHKAETLKFVGVDPSNH